MRKITEVILLKSYIKKIIFVIFCYFPLDEWKKRVYNTATYESTQCQPQAAGTFQPLVDTGKKKSI